MAKVKLEGLQPMDFDTNDGKNIKGIKLHITYTDDNVIGRKCDDKFLSDIACKNLGITLEDLVPLCQSEVDLETNLNGKIVGISPV